VAVMSQVFRQALDVSVPLGAFSQTER
jgi:hypothetical protein